MKGRVASDDFAETDEEVSLMLDFCRGNQDAFIQLYRRYRDRMVAHARRMLDDQAGAEDAAQEVFLKLYRARDSYQPRSRFSTFLFRIATNHCLNQCARLERKLTTTDAYCGAGFASREGDPDRAYDRDRLRQALGRALRALPDKQRAALLLCHYEGFSYREAAEMVDVSESALKSLVHRAREAMIRELGNGPEIAREVIHAL